MRGGKSEANPLDKIVPEKWERHSVYRPLSVHSFTLRSSRAQASHVHIQISICLSTARDMAHTTHGSVHPSFPLQRTLLSSLQLPPRVLVREPCLHLSQINLAFDERQPLSFTYLHRLLYLQ